MNAAEEIVKYWYQSKGYFVMESVGFGRKEIDLLAVRLSPDKKKVEDKVHIEVQISINSVAGLSPEKEAHRYQEVKFEAVRPKVQELLGKKYRIVEVRGRMKHRGKDVRAEYIKWRKRQKVEVLPFETILGEVVRTLGARNELRPVIRALQYYVFHTPSS